MMTLIKTVLATFLLALTLAAPAAAQPPADAPISQFVRRIHQDHRGHMWFGTNGDGVIRYDGATLTTYGPADGLGGYAVRGIVEDAAGHLWIATEGGLTRYDGTGFKNFTVMDGPALGANDLWALTIDSGGTIWVGSLAGASSFDGETFTPFPLPAAEPDLSRGVTSVHIVHAIREDSRGRLMFATNGGVFIRDGDRLTNISTRDGLCGDVVNDVLEARDGSLWFATHHHGVCRLKDGEFTRFGPAEGVEGTEAWSLFEDREGDIWFPTEHYGVYRYHDGRFTRYGAETGLLSRAVQCVAEDREGRIWVGGHTGLYRTDDRERFVALGAGLPWP